MTAFAYIPEPTEVPPGTVHVGWLCTSPGHSCLVSLDAAEPTGAQGEFYLADSNHHASWLPVFALAAPPSAPPLAGFALTAP